MALARHSLGVLADAAPPRTMETVTLLVSELVTNAVRHGDLGPDESIWLKVAAPPGTIRAEVHGGGPEFEVPSRPGPEEIGGWGLYLVKELSSRWGVYRAEAIVVWFEVDHAG